MSYESQAKMILKHLRTYKEEGITALEALRKYGVLRLSGRIYELRNAGHDIPKEWVTVEARDGTKKRVARYKLLPRRRAVA